MEDFVLIHMETYTLYKQTGEIISESMKITSLKSSIRDNAGLENKIEAARTSLLANSTFDTYASFLTDGITSRRDRQGTFKSNHQWQVYAAFYNGNGDQGGSRRGRYSGRGRGRGRSR